MNVMAYLVIAYPKLSPGDLGAIQQYRSQHDHRLFTIVEPHFTVVFAVSGISVDVFTEEVKRLAAGTKPFHLTIRVATINKDVSGAYYHDFLVPDTGFSEFVKLHDRLYSGRLSDYLRLDIDYIPHIGIGNSEDASSAKQRVDQLNAQGISIDGFIDTLDIIEYVNGHVRTIERVALA